MKKIGNRTLLFEESPVIKGYASVVGKKESEGPLGKFFDRIIYDPYNGMETFEDAESSFQTEAISLAIEKKRSKKGRNRLHLRRRSAESVHRLKLWYP